MSYSLSSRCASGSHHVTGNPYKDCRGRALPNLFVLLSWIWHCWPLQHFSSQCCVHSTPCFSTAAPSTDISHTNAWTSGQFVSRISGCCLFSVLLSPAFIDDWHQLILVNIPVQTSHVQQSYRLFFKSGYIPSPPTPDVYSLVYSLKWIWGNLCCLRDSDQCS